MGKEGSPVHFAATGHPQVIINAERRQEMDTLAVRNAPGNGIFNRSMVAVRGHLHYILHVVAKPYVFGAL